MSRVFFTSRQRIPSERVDPWEREDRSSFGGGSQSSRAVTESRSRSNPLFGDGTCSWVMILNGINKYVTKMTEEVQDDQHRLHWRVYRETCCQSKTETNISTDFFFFNDYVAISSACLD